MSYNNGLLACSQLCMQADICCQHKECRLWIDHEEDHNCTLVSVYENGPMTLRQIAEREKISFARVKQIETQALKKLKKRCLNKGITFLGCLSIIPTNYR